jgi:hypothetical protein
MERVTQVPGRLQQYKVLFVVVVAVTALLVASPALQRILVYPQTDFFTELWLLGPGHTGEGYPFNITRSGDYSVFLGIGNHLGECGYYVVEVKFRNETMSAPDSFNGAASSLPSLYNMTVFVPDKQAWEERLTFNFDYGFDANMSRVEFNSMTLNGATLNLGGLTSELNATTSRFYGNLIFELWIYNASTSLFDYNNRFVDLKFNMNST